MSKPFPFVPVVLGLGALAVGGVLFWPKKAKAAMKPAPTPQALPTPKPAVAPPSPTPAPPPVPIPPPIPNVTPAEVYPLLVTGDGVNVRTGPGTNYPVITTVSKGTRLRLPHADSWAPPSPGAPEGWSGVLLADDRSGWMASQYLTIPPS